MATSLGVAGCSSPDGIIREAAQAASDNDREAYLACFTPRSRAMIRGIWTVSDDRNPEPFALRSAGGHAIEVLEIRGLPPGRDDTVRAIAAIDEGGQPLSVVLHQIGSQWRIDLIDTERVNSGGMDAIFSTTPP